MAKTKTTAKRVTKATLKPGTHDFLRANKYTACDDCGRLMKDMPAHKAAHKRGDIGEDGKRTDRSRTEALTFARRFNGRDATKRWKGLSAEQRIKAKVKVA